MNRLKGRKDRYKNPVLNWHMCISLYVLKILVFAEYKSDIQVELSLLLDSPWHDAYNYYSTST